jgi:hypothetical protein
MLWTKIGGNKNDGNKNAMQFVEIGGNKNDINIISIINIIININLITIITTTCYGLNDDIKTHQARAASYNSRSTGQAAEHNLYINIILHILRLPSLLLLPPLLLI